MKIAAIVCCLAVTALAGCEKGVPAMPFMPSSQQQIQDSVIALLRRTLAALPPGSVLDSTRFAGAGHNSYCDDDDSGATAPMRFHTIGELRTPDGADAVVAAGEAWRSWGWQVVERDGFGTPNRFGYAPDGHRIQIVTAATGHPPTVQASSPCFPRQIASDDIPVPDVLRAE